jgi:RNA polymerase sigma factor (sigma-70 family)
MQDTDRQLVEAARQGNQVAFGSLVDRYRNMVYGLGYHLTGSFEDARDLAQDTFVQAYLKLEQLRAPEKLGGWLCRIATNLHRMQVRIPHVVTVMLDERDTSPTPDDPSEIADVVRQALGKLRPPERLALTLQYIDGYSQAEIGAFLGVSAVTIKARVARARRHLRDEVMQMVENVFEANALPAAFRDDVAHAVEEMVQKIRQGLPAAMQEMPDPDHNVRKVKWRKIMDQIPKKLLPRPLQEIDKAPVIPVTSLSKKLRQEIYAGLCEAWFTWELVVVAKQLPWVNDPESVWLRFMEREGKPHFAIVDNPAEPVYSYVLSMDHAEKDDLLRPDGVDLGEVLKTCPLPAELRQAFAELDKYAPQPSDQLRLALYNEIARLMRTIQEHLPARFKKRMAAGVYISVRELSKASRALFQKAVHLQWGHQVLCAIVMVPTFFTSFDATTLTFTVYPHSPEVLKSLAGTEYVNVSGPQGWNMQVGLSDNSVLREMGG